jgi:hypothetical protein
MFVGYFSDEIRYNDNDFTEQIIIELDNFLMKTPKTKANILYRQDKYSDINDYSEKQTITEEHFFNTSLDNWHNSDNIQWEVRPLNSEKTKAHEIFQINNSNKENQVTFERGVNFYIDKICQKVERHVIYCHEVE